MNNISFRYANINDTSKILFFIKKIADYEKMTNEVICTEESLNDWLFNKKVAEVIFIEYNKKEIGFALFFHNFSTFVGKGGIYLEDLYLLPEYRGKGYGKALFLEVVKVAKERNCGRMEWCCLDWNTPSINFYKSLGAISMDEWTTYRLDSNTIKKLIK